MRKSGFDPRSAYVRFVVKNVALWQVFLRVLQLYPLSIIPTKLHTHHHVRVAFIRRTNGRRQGTFQEIMFFRKWGTIGYKSRLTFIFSVLRGLKPGETFIFTIQDVRCLLPSTPLCYLFITTRQFLSPLPYHFRYSQLHYDTQKDPISPLWRHSEPVGDTLVSNVSCLRKAYKESIIEKRSVHIRTVDTTR